MRPAKRYTSKSLSFATKQALSASPIANPSLAAAPALRRFVMLPIPDTPLSPSPAEGTPAFTPSAKAARQRALLRRRQDPLAPSYASALRACAASSDPLHEALRFRPHLSERDFLRVLCKQFRYAKKLWHIADELRTDLAYLNGDRRLALMTERELLLWAELPSRVQVYRGCYWDNTDGLAWSLDPEAAAAHVSGSSCRRDASPLLAMGSVALDDCIVKTAWNRISIVSSLVQVESVEQLES